MPVSDKLALVIGMDVYQNTDLKPLSCCKNDASDICDLLSEKGYTIVTGSPVIGSEIVEEKYGFYKMREAIINFFADAELSQILIFYFSGHGVNYKNEVYLASPQVDPKKPMLSGFSLSDLTLCMSQSPSKRIVGIIDSCYSGTAELPPSDEEKGPSNSAERALNTANRIWKNQPKGIFLLLSSQSDAASTGAASGKRNSLFTEYLLEGLRGVSCSNDANGVPNPDTGSIDQGGNVTPESLHRYVASRVWEKKKQRPEFKGEYFTSFSLLSCVEIAKKAQADKLIKELNNIDLSHLNRQNIGNELELMGDPRPGVGLTKEDGLPDICWKSVISGKVTIVSGQNPVAEVVKPFFAAAYPVTVAQFRSFLTNRVEFESDLWWEGIHKTSYQRLLDERLKTQRVNYPVTNVNWHEAVAFCRWLTAKNKGRWLVHDEMPNEPFVIGENVVIRLPSAWERKQASTNGEPNNKFPWGEKMDQRMANTEKSNLGCAIAVGMYPEGKTVNGLMDMLGNVNEWCLNEKDESLANPFQNVGVTPDPQSRRVAVGGSFTTNFDTLTESCPIFTCNSGSSRANIGFRVVCGFELK